jgi:NAD(P)-dependent dehydrogenase (short-subunit alcohol dehydrogenase family)
MPLRPSNGPLSTFDVATTTLDGFKLKKPFANDVKLKNDRERHMMLKRWGKPKDIANGCLFLSSELASYITGIELMIDGGWSSNGLTE